MPTNEKHRRTPSQRAPVATRKAGRKVARHKKTMMLQTLMEGDAAAIVQTVINQAKAGDMTAARCATFA